MPNITYLCIVNHSICWEIDRTGKLLIPFFFTIMLTHYKAILRLAIPITIGQLGIIIMGFADTMMVGHYSTDALAAAAFVNSVFNLIMYFLLGYSYGITPLVSALYGQGRHKEAGSTLKHGLVCNVLFSLCLTLLMGVLYFFLDGLGQPVELLPIIRPYYLTILCSVLFVALFNALRQFTDGITATSVGMWALLISNAFNIAGNYFLIYGVGPFPELGLYGAGLSTLFSRILMVVILVSVLLFRPAYRIYRQGMRSIRMSGSQLCYLNRQSFPISMQMGLECGAFTFSGIMAGWLGAVDLATFQVMVTIGTLGFSIYYSFGAALSIRVATFYGLRQWDSVHSVTRAGVHILFTLACCTSLLFFFGGEQLIRLFTNDMAVIALSMSVIPPLIIYQLGDAMQICFANALRGTSHVMPMMWVAFISYVVVNIPIAYILAFPVGWGIFGLFVAFSTGLFVAASLFYYNYRRVMRQVTAAA